MVIDKTFIRNNLELFKKILVLSPSVTKQTMTALEDGIVQVQELNKLYIFSDSRVSQLINQKRQLGRFLPINYTEIQNQDVMQKLVSSPYNIQQFLNPSPQTSRILPFDYSYDIFNMKANIGFIEEAKPFYLSDANLDFEYKQNVIKDAKQQVGVGGRTQLEKIITTITSAGQRQQNEIKIYGTVTKGKPYSAEVSAVNHVEEITFSGTVPAANPSDPEVSFLVDGKIVVQQKGNTLEQVINDVVAQLGVFQDIYQSVVKTQSTKVTVTYTNSGPKQFADFQDISGSGVQYAHSVKTLGVLYSPEQLAQTFKLYINDTFVTIVNGESGSQIASKIISTSTPEFQAKTVSGFTLNITHQPIGHIPMSVYVQEPDTGISITNQISLMGYGTDVILQSVELTFQHSPTKLIIPKYSNKNSVMERISYFFTNEIDTISYFDGTSINIERNDFGPMTPIQIVSIPPGSGLTFQYQTTRTGEVDSSFQTTLPITDSGIENLFMDTQHPLQTDPLSMKKRFREIYKKVLLQYEIIDKLDLTDTYKIQINTNQNISKFSLYMTQLTNLVNESYPDAFVVQNVINRFAMDLGASVNFTDTQIDQYINQNDDQFDSFPLVALCILDMTCELAIQHYTNVSTSPIAGTRLQNLNELKNNIIVLKNKIFKFIDIIQQINVSTYKYMKVFKV